ncbi:MAG TPA: TetR/AcrR family transcriptional regulator [Candidatus Limnocylindria bacterium]|nr:TetR/AcrR family transcriptional regulator [Candidatus Limnocylindria bacterium]
MRARRQHELRPRRRPSQARSRETVAAIVEAAARIFAAEGYAGATTNRIAEAAGVSVGSLYEYFPNKDALLVALIEAHVAEGQALLDEAATEVMARALPLPAAVRRLVDAMIALHARNRALHRVLFDEAPLPPRVRRQVDAAEEAIAARIAGYLRERPEVTVPDPALAAAVVVQAVEAVVHRLVVHGDERQLAAQARELVALVVSYLTADRRRLS